MNFLGRLGLAVALLVMSGWLLDIMQALEVTSSIDWSAVVFWALVLFVFFGGKIND